MWCIIPQWRARMPKRTARPWRDIGCHPSWDLFCVCGRKHPSGRAWTRSEQMQPCPGVSQLPSGSEDWRILHRFALYIRGASVRRISRTYGLTERKVREDCTRLAKSTKALAILSQSGYSLSAAFAQPDGPLPLELEATPENELADQSARSAAGDGKATQSA